MMSKDRQKALTRRRFLGGLVSAGCQAAVGCRSLNGESLSFAMINDFHENVSFFDRLAPWIIGCDFTVVAGDILNDVRADGSVQTLLVDPMDALHRRTGVPCEFVRGNHETRGPAAGKLHEALGFKDGVYYRAKTVKGARCLFLDTAENRPSQQMSAERYAMFERYLTDERRWLEREVASADWRTARARFVFLHIPPAIVNPDADTRARAPIQRSVRREAPVTGLYEVLRTANVTAMFSGHVHIGAFDEPSDEHPYPVIVGGGHSDPVRCRLTEALLTRCDVSSASFRVRQYALDGTIRRERTFAL
ncbi:MAG: metallophosphoesterase [Kiritimatiellae bacterium]|nr:metallophosphoesterase [Kiritimatiellia bacterium]